MTVEVRNLEGFEAAAEEDAKILAKDKSGDPWEISFGVLSRVIQDIAHKIVAENLSKVAKVDDATSHGRHLTQPYPARHPSFAHAPLQARITFTDIDGSTKVLVRDHPFREDEKVDIDLSNPGASGFRYEREP